MEEDVHKHKNLNIKPHETKARPEVVEEDVPEKDSAVDSLVLHHVVVRPHPEHCLSCVCACVQACPRITARQERKQAATHGDPVDQTSAISHKWVGVGRARRSMCARHLCSTFEVCCLKCSATREHGRQLPGSRLSRRLGPPHSPLPPYASHLTSNAPHHKLHCTHTHAGTLVGLVLSAPRRCAGACSSISAEAAIQRRRAPRLAIRASCSSVLTRQVC